jgi:hypothetical protein
LEKRGVVAIAFGTKAFESLAKLQAKAMGLPDLPIVMIEHPLGGIPAEQAIAKAQAIAEQVAAQVQERMAASTAK